MKGIKTDRNVGFQNFKTSDVWQEHVKERRIKFGFTALSRAPLQMWLHAAAASEVTS